MRSAHRAALLDSLQPCLEVWVSLQPIIQDQDIVFFSFLIIKLAMMPASMLRDYSTSASLTPSDFFYVASTYWKITSYRSALDLAMFGTLLTGRLLCWLLFSLDRRARYSICRWFQDFVMTPSRSLHLHITRGLARHGYPWVPTDQGLSCP